MRIKLLIIAGCAVALLASCEKEAVVMSDAGTTTKSTSGTTNTQTSVSFANDIIPILTANCVSCHNTGSRFSCAKAEAYNTIVNRGFVNTVDPEKSKFFVNALQGHPDDYLLPAEHQKIVTWMKEGAKNN